MARTVAIVQARMGSRRLPGKVLALLGGSPVIWHVITRAAQGRTVDQVVVATSDQPGDDQISGWCEAEGLRCVRGPEADVLSRYALAAEASAADVVVRVTADCPLLSPAVLDLVVDARAAAGADYASNTLARGFPHGLDVECLTRAALDSAAAEALDPEEREHVTPFVYNRPDRFHLASVVGLQFPEADDLAHNLGIVAGRFGFGIDVLDIVADALLFFLEAFDALDQEAQAVVGGIGHFGNLRWDA